MAVTETPAPDVAVASPLAEPAARPAPTGFAAVLGSGDHKVIGRLFLATALLFGAGGTVLSIGFGAEAVAPETLDVFSRDSVFQLFTLLRLGLVFLVAVPALLGLAMVVVPLQVGSRAIAFPRAAAASYWGWLLGSALLIASYAMDGGPGGGREEGIELWITSMGAVTLSLVLAAVCIATTVVALRAPGMSLSRIPLYSWSAFVASAMWILTLPVVFGLIVLDYVDLHFAGGQLGDSTTLYYGLQWVLRNPQIYVLGIPALGFLLDVAATTADERISPRGVAQIAVGLFGVLSFGAFLLAAPDTGVESWVVIGMGLTAGLPVLLTLALVGDLFRRGSLAINAGIVYAMSAVLLLLVGVGAGALGSIPAIEAYGTIADLGVNHAVVVAALISVLGGLHWWATKIGRQPANETLSRLVPALLLVGGLAVSIPDVVSGIAGEGAEIRADWTGGIEALNVVVVIGTGLIALGMLVAVGAFLPLLRSADQSPRDPWEGQTLEWLTASPPPLDNFDADLPAIESAEPLVDAREEK